MCNDNNDGVLAKIEDLMARKEAYVRVDKIDQMLNMLISTWSAIQLIGRRRQHTKV